MRLGHRVDGPEDAAVLVLSPSLGTTTSLFDSQLSALARRFRVVRHDLPGHGASPLPEGPVSVEDIARDVLVLLDELGIERASFCGVSIGGMVAMWLGAHAPERVERLTLCCTGAKLGSRDDYKARAALVLREGTGVMVPGARERWFLPEHRDTPDAQRILAELAAIPPAGYAACCEAVSEWDFRDELPSVAARTTLLFGDHDSVTTADVRETLVRGIARARALSIPGAHLANVDNPEAFTAAVLEESDD
jgi:3-oxoadipate enol-lactonase